MTNQPLHERPLTNRQPAAANYLRRMAGFAGAGLIGTIFHYLTLLCGTGLLGRDPVSASVAGALIGATINYLLNYYINYRSSHGHRHAGPRFFLVAGVGFALNWGLMSLFIHRLHVHYVIAQLIVTALVFFWNFTTNHFWTFRTHQPHPPR